MFPSSLRSASRRVLLAALLVEAVTIEAFSRQYSIDARIFVCQGVPTDRATEDPMTWPLAPPPPPEEEGSGEASPKWIAFLERELEWGRRVRAGLRLKKGHVGAEAPQESLVEAQQRFTTFLRNELDWGAKV